MNFIISIIFFVISSIISFIVAHYVPGNGGTFFMGASAFFAVIAFIFAVAAVFCTMNYREDQKQNITRIKTYSDQIALQKKLVETYKSEVSNSLMKLYPDYEKEIFKSINPADAENLSVFMAKYPELKFNGVLQSFTDKLTVMLRRINEIEEYRAATVGTIKDLDNNSWFMFKVEVPLTILNLSLEC